MAVLITLFYILFTICIIYPPSEFESAGVTIAQIFDGVLGSENVNFVQYHMRRICLTLLIHSFLPLGYVLSLMLGDANGPWLEAAAYLTAVLPFIVGFKVYKWSHGSSKEHPIAKILALNASNDANWLSVAADLNVEFRSVNKLSIPLTAISKFVVTESWLVKVSQYSMYMVRQDQAALVATATDSHHLTQNSEVIVQYVNIEVIPARQVIPGFKIRVTTATLRDLQRQLSQPVRVPDHLTLQKPLIESFVAVFAEHVAMNPIYYIDQDVDTCMGCLQSPADVKLERRCDPSVTSPDEPQSPPLGPCQQCNCRVLWCCACVARWWAARARGGPAEWLAARSTCPLCRAPFCLLDVRPVRRI